MAKTKQHSEKLDFEKVWLMFQETKELLARSSLETDRKIKESTRETKELLANSSFETDRKFHDSINETKELLDRQSLEADKRRKETDKQIKELGKQIGGLGNKFGSYNEGLFIPSLKKILKTKFKCTYISTNVTFKDNGNSFEIDLFGNSKDSCYIVEIKSHLNLEDISQLKRIIADFRKYSIKYSDMELYGIIAATHYKEQTVKKVIDSGTYFISTSEDIAKLMVPRNFKPMVW